MSPFCPSFSPPASVFSQRPLTRQPNFYAAWPSSTFSAACRLLVSLCSLFRTRFLCFQQFAHSFAKTPGVGVSPSGFWTLGGSRRRLPVPETQLRDTGGGYLATSAPPSASAVICATWRLYPLWPHSIARPSCHHGGCTPTLFLRCGESDGLALYFHNDTNPFSRNPFPFTSIQNAGGVGGCHLIFVLASKEEDLLTGNGAQPEIAVPREGRPPPFDAPLEDRGKQGKQSAAAT